MKFSHKSVELEYYVREGISPVHQNISNLKKHFQTRESLYRLLGLLPNFFAKKNVLEVGPGSGHNSIYISSLFPKTYQLVEPNPIGVKDIKKIFKKLKVKHTKPIIFTKGLEDIKKKKIYDIVISEGWLGGIDRYEKKIYKRLSSFVKSGGLLINTFYPPIGGMPTFLRRLLSYRLISNKDNMEKKVKILKKAFKSHLLTLSSMSRSHKHWIQDNILNPHIYVGISNPNIFSSILKNKFTIYHSVPNFNTEWRWYKSLYGNKRKFNENFLFRYNSISHCLIDYKKRESLRSEKKNIKLEKLCLDLAIKSKKNEELGYEKYIKIIDPVYTKIINNLYTDLPLYLQKGLLEARTLLRKKNLLISDIYKMKYFKFIFGRDQCYLSMTNS